MTENETWTLGQALNKIEELTRVIAARETEIYLLNEALRYAREAAEEAVKTSQLATRKLSEYTGVEYRPKI
jgi:hypothetical protein